MPIDGVIVEAKCPSPPRAFGAHRAVTAASRFGSVGTQAQRDEEVDKTHHKYAPNEPLISDSLNRIQCHCAAREGSQKLLVHRNKLDVEFLG